jgi:hypothetical protein
LEKEAKKKAAEELLDRMQNEKDEIAGLDVIHETRIVSKEQIKKKTRGFMF